MSLTPYFDCITYSGSGGTVSLQAVDVALVGWADRSAVTTGDLVKFDVSPSPTEVGTYSVATDALEWQWVPDDSTVAIWNPGCARHCEIFVDYSGAMYARAYTNGMMKTITVAHIQVTDQLSVTAVPAYGPAGFQARFTAQNSDSAGVNVNNWTFIPDSAGGTMPTSCGSANPCVWNVPVSGTMQATVVVHGRLKKATVHVDVVPCPTSDALLDNPALRRMMDSLWKLSFPNPSNPESWRERNMFVYDSSGTTIGSQSLIR